MDFITETDLLAIIRQDVIDSLKEDDTANLDKASSLAKSEVEDYLNTLYDTQQIFNKTGTERHESIIRVMGELTLYYAHKKIMPNNIPELRRLGYEDSLKWLKDVCAGRISPKNLPRIENEDGSTQTNFRYGTDNRMTEAW